MARETRALAVSRVARPGRPTFVGVGAASLLVLLWLFCTPATAEATTFTVTKIADTNDGTCNADCSLREAIFAADASAATPHTITFAASLAGCGTGPCGITVVSPLPAITRSFTTLDGLAAPGGMIQINGNSQSISGSGLTVVASNVTIKGVWVYAFNGPGIAVVGDDNTIVSNYLGDVTGSVPANTGDGLFVSHSIRTQIGGATASLRNVISGNIRDGIHLDNAVDTVIKGNYVGTNVAGTAARPNYRYGILVGTSGNTAIGGLPSERNVISGNGGPGAGDTGDGIRASGALTVAINGNYIGLAADGSPNLGNKNDGIAITANSTYIHVGSDTADTANFIAYNGGAGIHCFRSSGTDLGCSNGRFPRNFIYLNGGLGIDLDTAGVTPNDFGDGDTGPNRLQNFPTILSASAGSGQTVISGSLNSQASRSYRLNFFVNNVCDASGNGEGLAFLTSVDVTTNGLGNASFSVVFPNALTPGNVVTGLAIDTVAFDTSEFSACRTVEAAGFVVTPTGGLQTTEAGGQATFTVRLTTLPTAEVTVGITSGDTTEGSVSPSSLTFGTVDGLVPRTVTVTGVADGIADGNVPYTIVLAPAASSDPQYNNLNPADVAAINFEGPPPPPPSACSPRPKITVTTTPESAGRLRITLGATGANNTLVQLHVLSTTNAEVEIGGQARTGDFTVPLSSTASTSFVVHRLQAGQSATVRAVVTDSCGDWPTFFGGGASGFP